MFLFIALQKYPAQSCALLCQRPPVGSGSDLGHGVYFPTCLQTKPLSVAQPKIKGSERFVRISGTFHPAKCFDACILSIREGNFNIPVSISQM